MKDHIIVQICIHILVLFGIDYLDIHTFPNEVFSVIVQALVIVCIKCWSKKNDR